ncbi:hypothetical protein HOG48_06260 [Candidatus Peregrinibacteria bacterium]|jgi:hypothetical protein|nr:hypothetical protein [Candidatus Peregrinibacteria bacterium]
MEHTQTTSKPWYKKWWGILLVISLFPITVPYLVWTKTKWNKWVKIAITLLCAIILFSGSIGSNERREEATSLVTQAQSYISEDKLNEALTALDQSEILNSSKSTNPAFALENEILNFQSEEFLERTLVEMSDSDFELLNKKELTTTYFQNTELNQRFINKLENNTEIRTLTLAIAEKEKRKELIEAQFSAWDGSHIKLTRSIKESMNDPGSYEHVKTSYWNMNGHIVVETTFRGKNAFGGLIMNTIKAKVSLTGEVLEILE